MEHLIIFPVWLAGMFAMWHLTQWVFKKMQFTQWEMGYLITVLGVSFIGSIALEIYEISITALILMLCVGLGLVSWFDPKPFVEGSDSAKKLLGQKVAMKPKDLQKFFKNKGYNGNKSLNSLGQLEISKMIIVPDHSQPMSCYLYFQNFPHFTCEEFKIYPHATTVIDHNEVITFKFIKEKWFWEQRTKNSVAINQPLINLEEKDTIIWSAAEQIINDINSCYDN